MATSPTSPVDSVWPRRAHDPDLHAGQRDPDRAQVPSAVTHRHGGDRTELGHPVAAQDLRRGRPDSEAAQGRRGNRRAADRDRGQAREVGRREAGGADDELHHRGHEEGRDGPVPLDGVDPGLGVEARQEPPAQPAAQGARDEERPAGRGEG